MPDLEVVRSEDLSSARRGEIRALLADAFAGEFSDDDWDHALGGWHVFVADGAVIAHAAVVERAIEVDGRPLRTGYVEAVATAVSRQRDRLGTAVMQHVHQILEDQFDFGALSTDLPEFYERLGWERWRGPTFVRDGDHLVRTPDEDDGIMVLRFGPASDLDLTRPISCEARPGDDW